MLYGLQLMIQIDSAHKLKAICIRLHALHMNRGHGG